MTKVSNKAQNLEKPSEGYKNLAKKLEKNKSGPNIFQQLGNLFWGKADAREHTSIKKKNIEQLKCGGCAQATNKLLNSTKLNTSQGVFRQSSNSDSVGKFLSKRWNEFTNFFSERSLGKTLADLPYHTTLACLASLHFMVASNNSKWRDAKQAAADELKPLNAFLAHPLTFLFSMEKGFLEKLGEKADK
jgi:hypothetical protein